MNKLMMSLLESMKELQMAEGILEDPKGHGNEKFFRFSP